MLDNCPNFPAGYPKAGQKTWTANDRGRGVAKVVVSYKVDKATAKHPVWSSGLPNFTWIVKGARCYIARKDDTVGGAGPHRWADGSTREWSENPIDCRYTWVRGLYAGDKVDQPNMLLLGRGLSTVEAPPENTFAPGNVCDEPVPLKVVLASLNADAAKHDLTIHLNTVSGLAVGMTLAINEEGGFTESGTVQGISGTDVTLAAGLEYDHPAFTAVSWSTDADNPATERRYRIGGAFGGDNAYIDTETDIATACGGWIVERDGSVEMVPGAAQPVVWHITDDDLIIGSTVTANDFRSITDDAWCNIVAAKYVEPSQQWKDHSAPVRILQADIIADGGQRVDQPTLPLATSGTQAQRVAEQRRRMGRLWRTRSLVLGPRFAGIEHGDWLSWQSNRYGKRPAAPMASLGIGLESGGGDIAMEGVPLLFQVQTDGQDEKWQNSIQLREIGFAVFD